MLGPHTHCSIYSDLYSMMRAFPLFIISMITWTSSKADGVGSEMSDVFTTSNPPGLCRVRGSSIAVKNYQRLSCAMCYVFLFRNERKILVALYPDFEKLYQPIVNNSTSEFTTPIEADISNDTLKNVICSTLNVDECYRWTQCCQAAQACCKRQLATAAGDQLGAEQCDRTWDGYRCWDDTPSDTEVTTQCPSYMIPFSLARGMAIKQCTKNGTWFKNSHSEWTDYRPCLNKNAYLIGVYIVLAFNIASLLFLVPAVVVFFLFRDLYRQHRVRLHINFFISLALNSLVTILWYMLVHKDLLTNPDSKTVIINKNPVWCRILSLLKIYLTSTNYFWMFCEGFYLHRLISKAFEPPKTLTWLYIFGWVVPAFFTITYSVIRSLYANNSCWTRSYGGFEWIYYGPNLLCLIVNLVFLGNIMRILLFQLHSHPNEPSNFRRGLKAAFMLIPLFGLQFFLTMYRPKAGAPGEKPFEYITFVITSSQGIFVAIIFCFFNSEVLAKMRKACPCWLGTEHYRQHSMVTEMTTTEDCHTRSPASSKRSEGGSPRHSRRLLENGQSGEGCEASVIGSKGMLNNTSSERNSKGYIKIPSISVSSPMP